MLQLRLRDRRTGTRLIAATTHLKAKAGARNEAIRERQVHWLLLRTNHAPRLAHELQQLRPVLFSQCAHINGMAP